MGERTRIVSSMTELGHALLLQGSLQEAEFYYIETIKLATDDRLLPAIVEALTGIATIQAQEEKIDSAYELAFYVLNHSATYPLIKERAQQLCSDLEPRLTPEQTESIQTAIQDKTIEGIIEQVLNHS